MESAVKLISRPWQNGPVELISYGIEHMGRDTEFDLRVGFLLLDVGVETLFKTFLQLSDDVTGTKMNYGDRVKKSSGNFHELRRAVQSAGAHRLKGVRVEDVEFYHGIRNRLYHQGNGVTVERQNAESYAGLAIELLKRLLGVDLGSVVLTGDEKKEFEDTVNTMLSRLRNLVRSVETNLELTAERIDSRLVMPSFRREFAEWASEATDAYNASEETDLVDPDDTTDRIWAFAPEALKQVVSENGMEWDDFVLSVYDFSPDAYHGILLILAEKVFGVETDLGPYSLEGARGLIGPRSGIEWSNRWLGVADVRRFLLSRLEEVTEDLEWINEQLETAMSRDDD